MAAIGAHDGHSRAVNGSPAARWSGVIERSLLCASILCAPLVVSAGRAETADAAPPPSADRAAAAAALDGATPAAPAETELADVPREGAPAADAGSQLGREPPGDEAALAEEAAQLESSSEAAPRPPLVESQPGVETAAPVGSHGRLEAIKAAVNSALGDPDSRPTEIEETTDGGAGATSAAPAIDVRQQRLRELVGATPAPDAARDMAYVGELRREVAQTLVVGEARPANRGAEEAAGQRAAAGPAATAAGLPSGLYQVQAGDSLWKIARSQLGDGFNWPKIYYANRDALQDADELQIGQILRIPGR